MTMESSSGGNRRLLFQAVSSNLRNVTSNRCYSQGSWIAESLTEIAFDAILGREVELLKQLGREGDASSGADTLEGAVGMFIAFQVLTAFVQIVGVETLTSASASTIVVGEVLLERHVVT